MSAIYVAVLFACVNGNCGFVTTTKQTYNKEAECLRDGQEVINNFSINFPEGAIQGTCIKVDVGAI